MVPRKPLQFVSCKIIFNFIPTRTVESELTSSTAASIAGLADRPITEFKVYRAPIFTTFGFEEETLAFPVLAMTFMGTHRQNNTTINVLLMNRPVSISMQASNCLTDYSAISD
ncbi:hypothetical protein CsSME_00019919 [Camellia sinensis var. sinensis]